MVHLTKAKAKQIIGETGWLAHQPKAFRDEVLHRSILLNFAPDESIFRLGDPPGGIYGLVTGTVSVSIAPAASTPRLILLGVPGRWTGEGCFLTRTPRRGDLRAVVQTSMLHLPLDVMDQMAARDPNVPQYVTQMLMMSVEFLFRVINDLQKPDADRRIASVLQRTSWIGEVPIPLTQTELGTMANASRKQVNRALKRFSEAGWITNSYRSITITDAPALRRLAEGDGTD